MGIEAHHKSMWSDADSAPMCLIENGISDHQKPGGLGPNSIDRLDRHIKDHYSRITECIPKKYNNGLPEDMRLERATKKVGELTFYNIEDFETLKIEIVEERENLDKDVFFEYIGLRVLQNGSGNLLEKLT